MARNWTDAQKAAISARNRGVLVSAAAGSGKTSVLTERVISLIKEGHDINRLLIVTYTNAAAAEMRGRIKENLSALIANNPEDSHLRRQILLLPSAQISTIHAFCLNLVRENYEKTGISPGAKIGDGDDVSALKRDAAKAVVRDFVRSSEEETFAMINPGKGDDRIVENIISAHEYISSFPFPSQCIDRLEGLLNPETPFTESIYYKVLKEKALGDIAYGISLEENILNEAEGINLELADEIRKTAGPDIALLKRMADFLENDDYENFRQTLSESFVRISAIKQSEEMKKRFDDIRKTVKTQVSKIKTNLFSYSEEEYADDMSKIYPAGKLFFNMVREYSAVYKELKKEKDILDFSDVERLTIDLLYKNENELSSFALELSDEYDEIMVDEFQDTNETQYAIFKALSKDEQNLFTVGDVKQSIYRFRLADPTIFLRRKSLCGENSPAPRLVNLNDNFRSSKGVCDMVNTVFSSIMSTSVGEMEYSEEERLNPKANDDSETEIIVAENDTPESEARAVLSRIEELLKSGITVGGEHIDVSYDDIAILMSARTKYPVFLKVFAAAGVPLISDSSDDIFATRECDSLLSFLRTIDNPCYDLHFAAAFLSPVFGFTPDDLVELKSLGERSLYAAAVKSQNERIRGFAETLKSYRAYSFSLTASELIKKIFYETDFVEIFESVSSLSSVRTNLMKVLSISEGEITLSQFLRKCDKYKKGKAGADAAAVSGAVRMMTIHGSKGLEFPVCIIADNARPHSDDREQPVVLHKNIGICMKIRDFDRHITYTTATVEAAKIVKRNELLSERMRVLYVALTRAQKKLIITAAVKNRDKYLLDLSGKISYSVAPSQIMSAKNDLEWILFGVMAPNEEGGILPGVGIKPSSGVKLILSDGQTETSRSEERIKASPSEEVLEILHQTAAFKYQDSGIEKIPVRLSVSDISKSGKNSMILSRPAFATKTEASAAERGTAMHKFMQYADYDLSYKSIDDEMKRLKDKEFLSENEISLCDKEKLKAFFNSKLYERISSADRIKREYAFMFAKNAGELMETAEKFKCEKVLIQGIADCVIIENGVFSVIDYKTDNVKDENTLIDRYSTQLKLYCEALEEKLSMPAGDIIIYSFALGKEIKL